MTLEVTRQLDFAGEATRLYIQGGERVHRRHVDRFVAFCSIGLDRRRDGKPLVSSVKPGRFTIVETRLNMRVSGAAPRKPVQVAFGAAGGGSAPLQVVQGDAPPSIHLFDTIITLHSEEQPQVADLTCTYEGTVAGNHLSRAEIQDTLGELVRFY